MKQLILVFIGGGTGSVARFLISKYLNNEISPIPYGTLTVNILGSFLIGIVLGLAIKNNILSQNAVLFLATGFCGGFTTFSTFAYENHILLQSNNFVSFFIYSLLTFIIGFLLVFLGMWITK